MQDLQTTIAVAAVIAFVAMLIAGATNKIVIYFNVRDFFVSFMPWVSILLGWALMDVYQHEGELDLNALSGIQSFILYASLTVSAMFFVWSMKLSITHNRSVLLGLLVGIFKILSALLGVLVLAGQVGKIFDDKSRMKEVLVASIVIGIFVWLGDKLVNGERVYLAKGWTLPERDNAST